jgi:hypothetical protein
MTKQARQPKPGQPASIARTDVAHPAKAEIAMRAHEIYLARGGTGGSQLDDWLQAERELKAKPGGAPAGNPRATNAHPRKS